MNFKKLQPRTACALFVDNLVDDGDGRLGEDRDARDNDLELVLAEFVDGEEGLVFPGQQHVADTALDKRHGRSARAGVEHGHIGVDRFHEVARLGVAAVLLQA